jgi:hypothetical protein
MNNTAEVAALIIRERNELVLMLRRLTHPAADESDLEDALELLMKYESVRHDNR